MRAILGGKRYNTETATKLAAVDYGHRSDFRHWAEGIYKTQNGQYFLAGNGAAASKYRVSVGQNEWGPGGWITPVTPEAAQAWLEEHHFLAVLEAEFGADIQDA